MHYIYKITIISNNKIYIGQTQNISKRWSQHKLEASKNKPSMIVNNAMKKYGIEKCQIEIIDFAQNYWQADCLEQNYIKQYESHINSGKGYNVSLGGPVAPKSEEWKQMMRDWYTSLSPEQKAIRNEMHRQNMINLIATKGHPAQGRLVTEEEKELHRKARLEKPLEYTPELRQKMSESHLGYQDSEDTKVKKAESAKEAWEKRIDYSRKCSAPGCEVSGKVKYKIVNGIRYCVAHGFRMLRNGILDKLPTSKYIKDNPMPEEIRKKCGFKNIGRVAPNRKQFTEEQILLIISDSRSNRKIAKDFDVTEKVIKRVKNGNY